MEPTASIRSKSCHIVMFGGLLVKKEGSEPVEFLPQQPSALLAYLALHIQRNPTREEVAAQLLPEEAPEQAQRKLRRYLHELRRRLEQPSLDQAGLLLTTRKTIRLDPERVSTDVEDFEEALHAATRTADLQEQERHLRQAVRLYKGDLLLGFYQECFTTERHRLSHLYERALHSLTHVYEQLGDRERAMEYARRVIALDPLKEEAHCTLMRLYAEMGQPSAILKQYQELARTLKEELNEEPSAATRQLMATLREQAQANVPYAVNGNGGSGKPVDSSLEYAPPPVETETEPVSPASQPASHQIPPASVLLPARSLPSPAHPLRWLMAAAILVFLIALSVGLLRHRPTTAGRPDWYVADAKTLWVARYSPAPDEKANCQPTAMTTDAAGNIYITGFLSTLHNDVDFLTLKYDPNGKLLWRARYNGPGNDVDRARSIAVDKDGNVYVTGDSDNGKGNGLTRLSGLDWATIKYDKDGNQLWVARYNGPRDGEDRPVKVCVDWQGFVYVAGISSAQRRFRGQWGPYEEWALVKYDPMGRQIWARRERSASDWLNAAAADMVLDPAGNIYVTGNVQTDRLFKEKWDLLTIKYAPTGDCLWKRTYSGKGYGDVTACRIALDGSSHVYVTGRQYDGDLMNNGSQMDIVTLKYDVDGNEIWCRVFDHKHGNDEPQAMAVDSASNVTITGHSEHSGEMHYLTLRYNASGDLQWMREYRGTGNRSDDALDVALDPEGNAIVTGAAWDGSVGSHAGTDFDYVTIKYDPAGRAQWKGVYDGNGWGDRAYVVAVDCSNAVIVSGQSDSGNGTPVIATVKYAP